VPLCSIKDQLELIFKKWGKPKAIRVDNGEPLGSPEPSTTTPLALWLIGYGIHVIWNKPHCPQQNGKVERNQSTSRRWSEILKCDNFLSAQKQLDYAAQIQRDVFPVSRLKFQTRKEVFRDLYTIHRPWNEQDFDIMRVYDFLKAKKYVRKVSSNKQVSHFGFKISVPIQYKGQYVTLKLEVIDIDLNDIHVNWLVFEATGKLIKKIQASHLSKQNLLDLSVMSKN
jgi:hypothetical protein